MQQKFVIGAGGNGRAVTTLRLAAEEGLKARKIIAQGKRSETSAALGSEQNEFKP